MHYKNVDNIEEWEPDEEWNDNDDLDHDEDFPVKEDEVIPEDEPNDDEVTPEELPNPEPEISQKRGMRRARSEDGDDKGGLDLPQLKKRRAVELPSDSEDDWSPRCPPRQPDGRWADEGPSDPRVEVWEEWWDDQLQKKFEEETEALKLREAAEDLEDEESNTEEGNNEEVDMYRTKYIDWEAKEVIDLVSSSDESG